MDGLPRKSKATEEQLRKGNQWSEGLEDEEMLAEEFDEKRLTEEQRRMFDEAKDKALMVWIENSAWKAVEESEAREGEVVPARFLQRWKKTEEGEKANARVIIQGFKHRDVLEQKLETDSPTLARQSRMLIYVLAVHMRWKLFSADVKSAFMQADSIDETTRIYVKPTSDMRRRLERLMDLKPWQILKATKPAFGDVRAPRQWYTTADGVVTEDLRMLRHALDKCVYVSTRMAVAEDDDFRVFMHEGQRMVVDGVLGMHVDDFIGTGEGVVGAQDLEGEYNGDFLSFRDRLCGLSRRFRFGSWSFGNTMEFCGAEVEQSLDYETVQISMAEYVRKVKPLTIDKNRKTMSGDPCTANAQRQLRAIVGAMAWPANQCLPQTSATCSLLQASVANPTVSDLSEANKGLRFMKDVGKDYKLQIHNHGSLESLRFAVYADAAWAVRPDDTSQGGYIIFIASKEEINEGRAMKLSVLDWSSRKLARVCRSSLAAEAQSASVAVDALEWLRICWSLMLWPTISYEDDSVLQSTGESPVLTDAKALFDSVNSLTQNKASDRRTSIEISIIRDRLQAMMSKMKWVNSGQQLADGLTKRQAREQFAYLLQRGVHRLVYDESFVADKKVGKDVKERQHAEMEKLAKEMFEGHVFAVEDEKSERGKCALKGCEKKIDLTEGKNQFCSRRHYYLNLHRKQSCGDPCGDPWKKAAMHAVAIIAAESVTSAEAAITEKEDEQFWTFTMTFAVIIIFAFIGAFGVVIKIKDVLAYFSALLSKFFAFSRNDIAFQNEPTLVNDQVFEEIYASRSHGAAVRVRDAGTGSAEAEPLRCDASVGSSDTDHSPKSVPATDGPDVIQCKHLRVNWQGTNGVQWKWTCLDCLAFQVVKKGEGVSKPVPAVSGVKAPMRDEWKKRMERMFDEGMIVDKIIQTPLTFDRQGHRPGWMYVREGVHGAFKHLSAFQDRV